MRYVHGNGDERHRIDVRRLMKSVLLEAKLETRSPAAWYDFTGALRTRIPPLCGLINATDMIDKFRNHRVG